MLRTMTLMVGLLMALVPPGDEATHPGALIGDDAARAKELATQLEDRFAAGQFNDAERVAQQLYDLRKNRQGKEHWESIDALWSLRLMQRARKLSNEQQRELLSARKADALRSELQDDRGFQKAKELAEKEAKEAAEKAQEAPAEAADEEASKEDTPAEAKAEKADTDTAQEEKAEKKKPAKKEASEQEPAKEDS